MRGGVCWDMISLSQTVLPVAQPAAIGGGVPTATPPPLLLAPVQSVQQLQGNTHAWDILMHSHLPMLIPKQEIIDEDKTDSGIHSGSDFHSSSPGSDCSSQECIVPSTMASIACSSTTISHPRKHHQLTYTHTPLSTQMKNYSLNYHLGFNPLTPPSVESMLSPKIVPENHRLTPNSSPNHATDDKLANDPLKQLELTFEKTDDYLPISMSSPKISEHSNDDDNTLEEFDEQGLRIPKINSHGKVKMFKCKQCDFVAITKLNFWEHSKGHIKTDKLLTCPKCPFVTEYKHHLEYHLRNHFGSKPFKCDKCSYSCVNKSMLNSHMKSHSNIYQYRCSDCSYATKYCHSLKLHLRKYCHKPAMVLNPDGTPNPLPIIDVYGSRRGPKMKSQQGEEFSHVIQNPLAQMMLNTPPQMQLPFPYSFLGAFGSNGLGSNPLFFPQLGQQLQQMLKSPEVDEEEADEDMERDPSPLARPLEKSPAEALDLSKPDLDQQNISNKNRRKGKAFKFDRNAMNESFCDEEDKVLEEPEVLLDENLASNDSIDVEVGSTTVKEKKKTESNNNNDYTCQFCNIAYGDVVLYTMHMGYHGYKDPFACNMCGEKCDDKVAFFLHIARNPHT